MILKALTFIQLVDPLTTVFCKLVGALYAGNFDDIRVTNLAMQEIVTTIKGKVKP